MKIKIEVDLTPDEVQDLFIPSNKQKEFAQALYKAYIDAMSKTVAKTVGRIIPGRSRDESSDAPPDS